MSIVERLREAKTVEYFEDGPPFNMQTELNLEAADYIERLEGALRRMDDIAELTLSRGDCRKCHGLVPKDWQP